ncbi:hypothetical protein EJ08DRAFT_695292 [Tothia fuscella]|uniref:Uncharacterized protein n=1 Tax=Tothia fuscella TaxID=1048955 RepID=A0A9P4NWD6_9PEZI|nr:hypothetical protein EJ08DRAFT_695292 [Tothia fuscella]
MAHFITDTPSPQAHSLATTSTQSSGSRFLRLPGETRNRIYSLMLAELPHETINDPIQGADGEYARGEVETCRVLADPSSSAPTDTYIDARPAHRQILRFASTCKQIRQELLPMYFAKPIELVFYHPIFEVFTNFMAQQQALHAQELAHFPITPIGEQARRITIIDRYGPLDPGFMDNVNLWSELDLVTNFRDDGIVEHQVLGADPEVRFDRATMTYIIGEPGNSDDHFYFHNKTRVTGEKHLDGFWYFFMGHGTG